MTMIEKKGFNRTWWLWQAESAALAWRTAVNLLPPDH